MDCGGQLEQALQALQAIADEGCGALVYLRGHEGRGIGLARKIGAYALQDSGLDTVDANTAQGLPVDSRSYGVGAQILSDLGIERLRLITHNPAKFGGLDGYGLQVVDRVALPVLQTPENVLYRAPSATAWVIASTSRLPARAGPATCRGSSPPDRHRPPRSAPQRAARRPRPRPRPRPGRGLRRAAPR